MQTGLPFDDIRALLGRLPEGDAVWADRVASGFAARRGETGDLGRLETLAIWAARWSGRTPSIRRPLVAIFAGSHGVSLRDWQDDPVTTIGRTMERWANGGTALNDLCAQHDLGLQAFDLALDMPTQDITEGDALDERGCTATMAFGMESVAGGVDLLCLTDPGIGNAVPVAALLAATLGGSGRDWLEAVTPDGLARTREIDLVDAALAFHGRRAAEPLEALRRLGGRETAAIAGAILAARMERGPVLLDGGAALASAAVVKALHPAALDHCLLAQRPGSAPLRAAAERLGLEPVLDAPIAPAAGVALAMAADIVRSAATLGASAVANRPS